MFKSTPWLAASISVVCLTLLVACGGGHSSHDGGTSGSVAESNVVASSKGTIDSGGGTISLSGVGAATFASGALSGKSVTVSKLEDPTRRQSFLDTTMIFGPGAPAAYQVSVNTGKAVPATETFTVTLAVPKEVTDAGAPQAFVLTRQSSDETSETLDGWELTPSDYDETTGLVTVTLDSNYLSPYFTKDGSYGVVLTIAPVVGSRSAPKAGALVVHRDASDESCEATAIGNPLATMTVLTQYGKLRKDTGGFYKLHYGADLAAAVGTDVMAAGDGKIETYDNVPGYGKTIVVRHTPGSVSTLYAHLSAFSVANGATVQEGDVIGKTGITGNAAGGPPHLHFELAPNGSIWARQNKINPLACTGNTVQADFRAGDNGNIADDQFSVYLTPIDKDGNATGARSSIFQTELGGYGQKSLGGLRVGEYKLELVCDVAPDDDGTYEIQLGGNLAFKTGDTTYRTGDLTQGETLTETLEVYSTKSRAANVMPPSRPNPHKG